MGQDPRERPEGDAEDDPTASAPPPDPTAGQQPADDPVTPATGEPTAPEEGLDPGADTGRFERFVAEDPLDDAPVERPSSNVFRVVTLLLGLGVLAVIVWLLLQ